MMYLEKKEIKFPAQLTVEKKSTCTVCLKTDPWDILKYFRHIWTDINKIWYRQLPMNLRSYGIKSVCEV